MFTNKKDSLHYITQTRKPANVNDCASAAVVEAHNLERP